MADRIDSAWKKAEEQYTNERKAQKSKRRIIILVIVSVLLLIAGYKGIEVYSTSQKYNEAVKLAKNGKAEEANSLFLELGDYKDSRERVNEYSYSSALQTINYGHLNSGYVQLLSLSDYKDANELIKNLEEQTPMLKVLKLNVGETFTFGHYEQDNQSSNGKEPIEWILINKDNNNIYAISKYVLDTQPFNQENKWSASIYDWINSDFQDNAFSKEEQNMISRICLLKKSEIIENEGKEPFVSIDLKAEFTDYALSLTPLKGAASGYGWWIERQCSSWPACSSAGSFFASMVSESGSPNYSADVWEKAGVRPTLWILTDDIYLPEETKYDGSISDYESKKTSSATSAKRACYGGSVGCRTGFHPCHEMSDGYCNQCCKDV